MEALTPRREAATRSGPSRTDGRKPNDTTQEGALYAVTATGAAVRPCRHGVEYRKVRVPNGPINGATDASGRRKAFPVASTPANAGVVCVVPYRTPELGVNC